MGEGNQAIVSENDIRPQIYDEARKQAQQADLAWLKAREAGFTACDCPACNSTRHSEAIRKLGFTWRRCTDCETLFMSPRPDAAILAEFYGRSELYKVWNDLIFPASNATRRVRIHRPRAERLQRLLAHAGGTFIEIGAAHGLFCEEIRASGSFSRIVAIEPSAAQAETCRRSGLETHEALAEDAADLDGIADAVACFETLEHVADPGTFCRTILRFMKPGGLFVLTTPNCLGFDVAFLGTRSDTVYPEHLTLFSPRGLAALAKRSGLDIVEQSTPGALDADIVRNKLLQDPSELEAQPFLKTILFDRWLELGQPFQAFLASNGLSSHMWLACRKPLS
jgi:2-polyprenyl-3-methyl-5-hydroxy-6-metoxy-1,4-benzoquinol methylase